MYARSDSAATLLVFVASFSFVFVSLLYPAEISITAAAAAAINLFII